MDPRHLDELVLLEEHYWWHVAKRQLVLSILQSHFPPPGRVVEGGVGSARNLLAFREAGYSVTGFDIMPQAVEHARRRGLDDVRQHDLSEPWPLEPNSTRAVVLLDVLEHVADPVRMLGHVAGVLEPGGGVVVTVPAIPWLFGEWDRRLGHFRRYTARTLRSQAGQAGLSVRWITHWNAFSLPAAVLLRGAQRVLPRHPAADAAPQFPRVSPAVNALLLGLARLERSCLNRAGVPVGLSLVGVLTK